MPLNLLDSAQLFSCTLLLHAVRHDDLSAYAPCKRVTSSAPNNAVAAAKRCPGGNLAASCMNAFDEAASVTFCRLSRYSSQSLGRWRPCQVFKVPQVF